MWSLTGDGGVREVVAMRELTVVVYHSSKISRLWHGARLDFQLQRETLVRNSRNGKTVGTVDLTEAFDTIDHEIILRNMWYLGVDQAAIKCFSSYLSGRTQGCIVSGKLSSARTVSCGVPQGSILGPLLFLIYIHDLPNSLRSAVLRMFADDTNLALSAKTLTELKLALTPELNDLSCWLKAK